MDQIFGQNFTNVTNSSHEPYLDMPGIWKTVPPILIPLGVTENIISVVVLCQRKFTGMPSRVTLISLAIIDSLVLFFGLFRYWMSAVFLIHPHEYNVVSCKILVFLVFALSHMSSSLVALVSIERFIAVWFPHRIKTLAIDSIGVPVTIFICIVINLQLLGTTILQRNKNWIPKTDGSTLHKYVCITDTEQTAVAVDVVDTLMLSYLPFALIVSCNAAIIYRLRKNSQKLNKVPKKDTNALAVARASVAGQGSNCTEQLELIKHGTPNLSLKELPFDNSTNPERRKSTFQVVVDKFKPKEKQDKPKSRNNRRDSRVTNMLLLVTFTFFFCNLPFALIHLIRTSLQLHSNLYWGIAWTVAYVLVYINNCLNFPIYMISQPSFREELARLCCCDKYFPRTRPDAIKDTNPNTKRNGVAGKK